jgi:hypothetical protein
MPKGGKLVANTNKPNQIHTVHRPNGWANIKPGAARPAKVFDTKAEAQAAGRKTAINQHAEHIVHNKDGKISEHNSYGNDPFPPKG